MWERCEKYTKLQLDKWNICTWGTRRNLKCDIEMNLKATESVEKLSG